MTVIDWFPRLKGYCLSQLFYLFLGEHDKLLIGGRVGDGEPCIGEELSHPHRHVNGMTCNAEIQVIGEQGIKLHTCQSAFRQ